ncbi:hypothetical protein SUGI_0041310 [Cryptomeria japonica]|nr:hypothetical protein SUGI_0041310 [Cryptomeria japonica]
MAATEKARFQPEQSLWQNNVEVETVQPTVWFFKLYSSKAKHSLLATILSDNKFKKKANRSLSFEYDGEEFWIVAADLDQFAGVSKSGLVGPASRQKEIRKKSKESLPVLNLWLGFDFL